MEEPQKIISYVTIPIQVAFNPNLTPTDKLMFWMIHSIDGKNHCWATNKYFASRLNISIRKVQSSITNLIKHRYIISNLNELKNSRVLQVTSTYLEEYKYLVYEYNKEEDDEKSHPGGMTFQPGGDEQKAIQINIIDNNNKPSFSKEKEDTSAKAESAESIFASCSKDVQNLFNYWNLLGEDTPIRKTRIANTKSFYNAIKNIKKALLSYSVEEISEAMDNYYFLLSDEHIKAINMSFAGNTVGLDEFFEFREYTRSRMLTDNPAHGIKSWFDECLNGKDYLIEKYVIRQKNEYPNTTAAIKKCWMESEYCTNKPTARDENNFALAARKLNEWLERNRNNYNIEDYFFDDPPKFVRIYMFPSIKYALNGADPKKVETTWLCTDAMFERRLHIYLSDKGLCI